MRNEQKWAVNVEGGKHMASDNNKKEKSFHRYNVQYGGKKNNNNNNNDEGNDDISLELSKPIKLQSKRM